MSRLIHFTLLCIMLIGAPMVIAAPLQCEKVVLSGEANWPPYSYMSEGQLKGAGIDLGRLLFRELNIPVEVRFFHHQRDLLHELERGGVDVMVGTYDVPRYEKILRLVRPHYYQDSLGIIVPAGSLIPFSHWDDLMGRVGITPENNQLSREFMDYSKKNLNVASKGDIRYNIRKLRRGEYEYVIGSAQLLSAAVNWYGEGEVEFLPMLVSAQDVYMGISAASPCKNYAAFLRNRLKQLRDSGTIDTMIFAHTAPKQSDGSPQFN